MNPQASRVLARGPHITLRHIEPADLAQIRPFAFTVSIAEPLSEAGALTRAFDAWGFWADDAGAVAIVDSTDDRLLGTAQFYRSAPCIHGYEMGYIIHDAADRGRGAATEAVKLFSEYLFETIPGFYRLQLVIEVRNVASWKLAERCGFVREGLMRSSGFGAGDPSDCFIYARTRKDWREAHHSPISMGGSPPRA